jgi:hypothetical protein
LSLHGSEFHGVDKKSIAAGSLFMARYGVGVRPAWPKVLSVMTGVMQQEVSRIMESLEIWFESVSPSGYQDWKDSVAKYQDLDGSEFILISSLDVGQIVS